MTDRMSHEDQMASLDAWLAEHGRPWHNTGYDARNEERMAHVANGGTLRPGTETHHAMRPRFRRGVPDEYGYVSDDGSHVNRWEPTEGWDW